MQDRKGKRERHPLATPPPQKKTYHTLTGTFRLPLYWEPIGSLNISRCLRDYAPLYFILITSCSGLSARDPLSSYNSLGIWIVSTPWSPREKINKSSIGQADPDLRLCGFLCERRRIYAGNSAVPAEGPVSPGKRGFHLSSRVAWAGATWEVITHPPGRPFMAKKEYQKPAKQTNAQKQLHFLPIIMFGS